MSEIVRNREIAVDAPESSQALAMLGLIAFTEGVTYRDCVDAARDELRNAFLDDGREI